MPQRGVAQVGVQVSVQVGIQVGGGEAPWRSRPGNERSGAFGHRPARRLLDAANSRRSEMDAVADGVGGALVHRFGNAAGPPGDEQGDALAPTFQNVERLFG